jgi:NADH:ubiquinone oxidoreductase subunit E
MDIDSGKVDALIERWGTGRDAAIPLLQGIQDEYRYVPIEAMDYICDKTEISASQIYGVVTFYTQFRMEPVGEHLIKVCKGTACHVSGAEGITEALADLLHVPDGGTTPDMQFTLSTVACVGCCSLAPVIMVDENTHGKLNRTSAEQVMLKEYGATAQDEN